MKTVIALPVAVVVTRYGSFRVVVVGQTDAKIVIGTFEVIRVAVGLSVVTTVKGSLANILVGFAVTATKQSTRLV